MFSKKFHSTDEQHRRYGDTSLSFSEEAKKYLMIVENLLYYLILNWRLANKGRVIHSPHATWMKNQRKLSEGRASWMKKEEHFPR